MNRRLPVFVVVFGAIAAMVVLADDPTGPHSADVGSTGTEAFGLPIAESADAQSSTWFCAGGTGIESETAFADHTVIVANASDDDVVGTLTVYAGSIREAVSGEDQLDDIDSSSTTETSETTETTEAPATPEPVTQQLEVPALARIEIRLGDVIPAELVSAVVEMPSGAIAVEHRVESVNGFDTAPCASNAAVDWHFAWGATTDDAREVLVFFNPFADDAVVDGSFITDDGPREPGRFDGLVIPAGSVVGLDLGDDVTIRPQIAASLRLRSGRVIVDRIQRFDGSDGPKGLTVRLGMTQPKPVWIFPDGLVDEGVRETIHLFNPTDRSAEVLIDIAPDDPATNGIPEPFEVSVQPGAQIAVDLGADGRVEPGVGHSAIVRVVNDGAVVAERVLRSSSPSERSGVSVATGSPVAASRWVFAGGGTSESQDEFLYVLNPSNEFLATFSIVALEDGQRLDVQGLTDLEVPPAGRLAIRVGSQIERDVALLVESSSPIVVERGLYAVEGPGVSNAIGIPFAGDLIEPPPFIDDTAGG
ncbi:MAG TPA: DUF5719 family protein [Acidimicrobiales bacterium]|nr:DUF5719 family protein [Acidimicrobiales bacterium]